MSACGICDKKLNKNLIQEEHTCFCVGALTVCLSLAEGARPCGLNFPRATDGSAQESLSLSTFALTSCLSFILFFVVYLICLVIAGPITPDWRPPSKETSLLFSIRSSLKWSLSYKLHSKVSCSFGTIEKNTYLLFNLVCLVRTVSCGPSFFPRLMVQAWSARAIKRVKKRGSITYGTDQANEVNKMFIIWL